MYSCDFPVLIKEIASGPSDPSSPGEVSSKMAEVQRMLNEMRKRNFNTQKAEAEREKEEAKSCK